MPRTSLERFGLPQVSLGRQREEVEMTRFYRLHEGAPVSRGVLVGGEWQGRSRAIRVQHGDNLHSCTLLLD